MTTLRRAAALIVFLPLGSIPVANADDLKFKGTVLDQVSLGRSPGEHIMKMTLLEMEPGAAIPEHTHKGPGLLRARGRDNHSLEERQDRNLQSGV
jgi:quercetin dioxygenase-like cupin family protein